MPSPSSPKKKEPETKKPAAKEGQTEIVVAAAAPAATAATAADAAAAAKSRDEDAATQPPPKKKRMCRFPGCDKVIKRSVMFYCLLLRFNCASFMARSTLYLICLFRSVLTLLPYFGSYYCCVAAIQMLSQGSCQKHGAKAKRCRVEGCDKQAQGTHDGMCKRHWKEAYAPTEPAANKEEKPPEPEGVSIYDHIIPQSIAFRPHHAISAGPKTANDSATNQLQHHPAAAAAFAPAVGAANGQGSPSEDTPLMMPLVAFLRANAGKPAGWHREEERRARGIRPVPALSCQLESWERQLVRCKENQHGL